MKLTDLTERYIVHEKSKGRKKQTLVHYQKRILHFITWLFTDRSATLANLTKSNIQQFVIYLENEPIQTETRYVYLRSLKLFLQFLYENHYLLCDYSPLITCPKLKSRKRKIWSLTEAKKKIEATRKRELLTERDKAIGALYLIENLKSTQIRELTILDIDLEAKEVRLCKKGQFKTLHPLTLKYLKSYLSSRVSLRPRKDYLMVSKTGCQMHLISVQQITRNLKTQ